MGDSIERAYARTRAARARAYAQLEREAQRGAELFAAARAALPDASLHRLRLRAKTAPPAGMMATAEELAQARRELGEAVGLAAV